MTQTWLWPSWPSPDLHLTFTRPGPGPELDNSSHILLRIFSLNSPEWASTGSRGVWEILKIQPHTALSWIPTRNFVLPLPKLFGVLYQILEGSKTLSCVQSTLLKYHQRRGSKYGPYSLEIHFIIQNLPKWDKNTMVVYCWKNEWLVLS